MQRPATSFLRRSIPLCILGLLIVGCAGPTGNTPHATPQSSPVPTGTLSSAITTVTTQVLTNMHLHAWNPQATTRGSVTGGLFINWKMSDPANTNNVRPGSDGDAQHNHDPQVDLLYLTALAEYQQLHPQDHTYDADLSRIMPLIQAEFQNYNLPKGWIYFYLLRDGLMLHNTSLVDDAHTAASNFYTRWYDPTLGVVYNRNHTQGDYETDHTIDCGAALIDAGMRWKQSDWVAAGEKTLEHTIAVALDPTYHLFYNSMLATQDGHDSVQNYQAKPSTQGEAIDSLLTAYTLTHNQQYVAVAGQVLQSLFGSSGLWDKTHSGFFFALDMSKGKLLTDYKETRSQSLTLIGLHHYNQVVMQGAKGEVLSSQEQQLTTALTDDFYQRTYHGYFYRMTPDFQVYVSRPGAGIGVEDYVTTEAMGSSLDALQQTEIRF